MTPKTPKEGSTMRTGYVLGRTRIQILALCLLLIMPTGRCTPVQLVIDEVIFIHSLGGKGDGDVCARWVDPVRDIWTATIKTTYPMQIHVENRSSHRSNPRSQSRAYISFSHPRFIQWVVLENLPPLTKGRECARETYL